MARLLGGTGDPSRAGRRRRLRRRRRRAPARRVARRRGSQRPRQGRAPAGRSARAAGPRGRRARSVRPARTGRARRARRRRRRAPARARRCRAGRPAPRARARGRLEARGTQRARPRRRSRPRRPRGRTAASPRRRRRPALSRRRERRGGRELVSRQHVRPSSNAARSRARHAAPRASAAAGGRLAGSRASACPIAASRRFGRSGRSGWSGGAPASIVAGHLRQRDAPERMLAGERLPEQDPDAPDVAGSARLLAAQPLGRDVGERAGHVADRGQRLRLVELGQAEVEQAHRDAVVLGEQDVRRLDVPMDDSAAVGVREAVEDLRRRLDRLAVAQLAGTHCIAKRPPADVLVGDVDVTGVGAEAVRAQAALVAQPRRRLGLALGAVGGLALARDDLERDVEARLLVAREPDRAGAAAAEWPQWAVAVEDELPAWERMCSGGHDFRWVGCRRSESFRGGHGRTNRYSCPDPPL